jgi:RNA polymerase sigma factor for flagellar operon FliA
MYAGTGREAMEERLILDNLPLVRHIVQKVASNFSSKDDLEDLISVGTLGLVKAAKAFDSRKDTEFRTYAYIRIRGAVIDELRSRTFLPPKSLKQLGLIRNAYRRLSDRTGEAPSDEALADELGIPLDQLYRTLAAARRQHFLCIHGLSEEQGESNLLPLDGLPSPMAQAERKELMEVVAATIMGLPQRERHVLMLYYERDLTMKEIAAVLELTEARVSQIHSSALFKLSMKLNTEVNDSTPAG